MFEYRFTATILIAILPYLHILPFNTYFLWVGTKAAENKRYREHFQAHNIHMGFILFILFTYNPYASYLEPFLFIICFFSHKNMLMVPVLIASIIGPGLMLGVARSIQSWIFRDQDQYVRSLEYKIGVFLLIHLALRYMLLEMHNKYYEFVKEEEIEKINFEEKKKIEENKK